MLATITVQERIETLLNLYAKLAPNGGVKIISL